MIEKFNTYITPFACEREVSVYVPDGLSYGEHCPVLYMYDGHNLFFNSDATYGKSWGIKEYLESTGQKLIVVGVKCNTEGNERLKEYCPYTNGALFDLHFEGRGEEYMQWLCHEFKPMIDSRYPTLPDREHTGIAGSSMGGLMALYSYCTHHNTFGRAACLSVSFGAVGEQLTETVKNCCPIPGDRVYIGWGAREGDRAMNDSLSTHSVEATHILLEKGVFVYPYMQPDGHHCEADWEKQLPLFMPWLFG